MKKIVHVDSKAYPVEVIFTDKYEVDFYQREYVWEQKQIDDLISDLTNEFLKNWRVGDETSAVKQYSPYFMGEIVLSEKDNGAFSIIDGQQRMTTFALLMIYLKNAFGHVPDFPEDLNKLIYKNRYGEKVFNLDIPERSSCMLGLYMNGEYTPTTGDGPSVRNLVNRYKDIENSWRPEIDETNINHFVYWLMGKVVFSKVWTDNDELAYIIFETMNDRGLSLTQIEMLRSYLLANIREQDRNKAIQLFDNAVAKLVSINSSAKSKLEFEFFKIYFRAQYAQDMSQGKDSSSDFVRIGQGFHRWVRDNENMLQLNDSNSYLDFIRRMARFADVFCMYHSFMAARDTRQFLYLIVNGDIMAPMSRPVTKI